MSVSASLVYTPFAAELPSGAGIIFLQRTWSAC